MKPISRLLPVLFVAIFLFSSCLDREDSALPKNPNTPKALQDGHASSIRMIKESRGDNLLDGIYADMLEKRPDLKKLEEDIDAHRRMESDSTNKYHRYLVKSNLFYHETGSVVNTLTDSVLKKDIQKILATSQVSYHNKTALLNKLISDLAKKDTSLNNYHAVLKLMVTLPVMEQFQNDELPDDKVLRKLNAGKQKLIDRTKVLTSAAK